MVPNPAVMALAKRNIGCLCNGLQHAIIWSNNVIQPSVLAYYNRGLDRDDSHLRSARL
jgi:hypothetical protein